jgi:hypothetical protein
MMQGEDNSSNHTAEKESAKVVEDETTKEQEERIEKDLEKVSYSSFLFVGVSLVESALSNHPISPRNPFLLWCRRFRLSLCSLTPLGKGRIKEIQGFSQQLVMW